MRIDSSSKSVPGGQSIVKRGRWMTKSFLNLFMGLTGKPKDKTIKASMLIDSLVQITLRELV